MTDGKYIITGNQLCKLTHGIDDTLECRELILKIRANTLSDELIKERNLVLSEVMTICKNSKNTIEHRHDATYHADARMDEVTDIVVKVSNLRRLDKIKRIATIEGQSEYKQYQELLGEK
jgi:hypothetical protein